jgi:hypothetical protein
MTSMSKRLKIISTVVVVALFIVLVIVGLRFVNLPGENRDGLQDTFITDAKPVGIIDEPPYTPVARTAPGWVVYDLYEIRVVLVWKASLFTEVMLVMQEL